MMKPMLFLLFLFVLPVLLVAQTSDKFKSLDSNNGFGDLRFGENFSSIMPKARLVHSPEVNNTRDYMISNPKYLIIGGFTADAAIARFVKDRLGAIDFFIEIKGKTAFSDIVAHFKDLLGEPAYMESYYIWRGVNLYYSITYNEESNSAIIIIASQKIK